MMANNWQRLGIWLKLNNRFDYAEYSASCRAAGIEPQNALEFAQKAGMVAAGISSYPGIAENEAYLKFINDNQQTTQQAQQAAGMAPATVKPCCGGGKVV